VDAIIQRGNKVMVDLKFFDIPETVQLAVRQLQNHGVSFATIHGNTPIIEAAVKEKSDLKILAVTVLTSFDESDMLEMGMTGSIRDLVLLRARKALQLGCDGVVSSPLEAEPLRDELGPNFLIVTPGIRPGLNRDVEKDDQRRVATAQQAIVNGADHVVIGRPISTSPDPLYTVKTILDDIGAGLALSAGR
jgi:orotidine-5'-phosphate decarboxylase